MNILATFLLLVVAFGLGFSAGAFERRYGTPAMLFYLLPASTLVVMGLLGCLGIKVLA
jgi:hypothetical protein